MKTVDELNAEVGWTNDPPPTPERKPLRAVTMSKEEMDEWWRVHVQKLPPTPKPMPNIQSEMFKPKPMTFEEAREKAKTAAPFPSASGETRGR
jgi:hypothetical protein